MLQLPVSDYNDNRPTEFTDADSEGDGVDEIDYDIIMRVTLMRTCCSDYDDHSSVVGATNMDDE